MKKLICSFLAMTLTVTCALPTRAMDIEETEDDPVPVTVTTTEELLEAIEDAEDGDTIYIGAMCEVPEGTTIGKSEKRLTLIRSEAALDKQMFSCMASAAFENLILDGNGGSECLIWIKANVAITDLTIRNRTGGGVDIQGGTVAIDRCRFEDNSADSGGHLWVQNGATVTIGNSVFLRGTATENGVGGAIRNSANITIDNCIFEGNTAGAGGGAIYTVDATCTIRGSSILCNSTTSGNGGGIFNAGTLALTDTMICKNTAPLCGADIFSNGNMTVSLTDSDLETVYQAENGKPLGFYADFAGNRFNGMANITEAQELPINTENAVSALLFVFEGDIHVQEPEPEDPDTEEGQEDEAPAPEPEQEREPEQPGEPSESPSHTNGGNHTRPSKDRDTSVPDASPTQEEPEQASIILSCGGATLDTSNRAFLAGYGDGVIGEEDLVTRAQVAQIIYRLLTDESREELQTTENSFNDVSTNAWYNLAVSTIARAGIVVGCGEGFRPGDYITRAQLITIMARFIPPAEQESTYTDASGHWAESYIGTAEAAGWLAGGGNLHPNEHITRQEVVEFINHVFDLCEGAG